ncbi:MAG: CsgG/HfaB family protein [Candidatus Marinimicrobia bacterium]|nr:CsgG/HfaB family protein [Candidatus Neomarinimicrobiota bacterium]
MNKRLPRLIKAIYQAMVILLFTVSISQEIEPEITMERKKLIILTGEEKDKDITEKIYQIASSTATQLNRYNVIDRNQLDRILKEQKLQHSGVVDQDQAIEIGKVAAANQALLIQVHNFGQKGVPTEKQKEKEEEEEPKTGLFGWVVKEVVKAEIDKEMEDVERYPNNIQTIIDGEMRLINIETSQSMASFNFHADYTGGVKAKSLSQALKQIKNQVNINLKNLYQLSSEVLEVQGNDVTLFLGKNMGVNAGTIFEIISRDEKKIVRDREIIVPGESIGLVEVKSVSIDASKGRILRKWDTIEPGYQAHEITDKIYTGGISGIYGSIPSNFRLRLIGNINPFKRSGGAVYGDIGVVKDSRDKYDLQFGFGFDLNYRLIRTSPFSMGIILSLPFDFHMRLDDGDICNEVHSVILPVFSPRVGMQTEIMLNSKTDIVIRGEYVLSSIEGKWFYTTTSEDSDESKSYAATWDNRGTPKIDYQRWVLSVGIRSTFFSSFTFE